METLKVGIVVFCFGVVVAIGGMAWLNYMKSHNSLPSLTPTVNTVSNTNMQVKKDIVTTTTKPDGTVIVVKDQTTSATISKVTTVKKDYSVGGGITNILNPDYKSYKGYYIEASRRLVGDSWITIRANGNKDVSLGLRYDF